ncbi:MAG: GNAT family N-acetyltransferase [Parachlamydia sp.]|nr:GNAT family N-acetyltransferase [Parachlamydia sp.]
MTPTSSATTPAIQGSRAHHTIDYKLLFGQQIRDYASVISPLLGIFAEWPYLYQQSDPLEDVKYILERYADQPDSVVCIAFDGKIAVGAAMGVPLTQAPQHYRDAFPENERRPDIFYWGEMVVLKEYRGEHIATELLTQLGRHVTESGKYKAICFASVEREADYRLSHHKPAKYVSLDVLWKRFGFEKRLDIRMQGKWTVLKEDADSLHEMFVWWKRLD